MSPHATKVLAFDLDGTLTQHKSPLSPEYRELLCQLGKKIYAADGRRRFLCPDI